MPSPSLAPGSPPEPQPAPGCRSLQSTDHLWPRHGGLGPASAGAAADCAGGDRDSSPACSPADFAVFGARSGPRGSGQPVKYTGGPCALRFRAVWKGKCPTRQIPQQTQPCLLHPKGWQQKTWANSRRRAEAKWPSAMALPATPSPPLSSLGWGALIGTLKLWDSRATSQQPPGSSRKKPSGRGEDCLGPLCVCTPVIEGSVWEPLIERCGPVGKQLLGTRCLPPAHLSLPTVPVCGGPPGPGQA